MKISYNKTIILIIIPLFFAGLSIGETGKNLEYIVFVGENIDIREFDQEQEENVISLDYAFKARYKVLDCIFGKLDQKVIEFRSYDHFGFPYFANFKYSLFFLVKEDGVFYQTKYQYFPLYKTKKGKWASPYPTDDYLHHNNLNTKIKPEKIKFPKNARIKLDKQLSQEEIKEFYPEPYYRIKKGYAIPVYGNFIPELFQLKKDGVLKDRGWFK